ncbi:MAG: type VI secretion system lipoprotein TssJ [Pseudomonadota bacterium]
MAFRMVKVASLALIAALFVAACSAPPPPPQKEPTVAQVNIRATDAANPDPNGRASPSAVFVYALKPGAPFETGDPDALTGGELGSLQESMTRIARMIVVPGKEQKKIFELPDGTTDIGVAVAYRQIDTAKWRVKQAVKPNEVTLLKATIDANEVTLN